MCFLVLDFKDSINFKFGHLYCVVIIHVISFGFMILYGEFSTVVITDY